MEITLAIDKFSVELLNKYNGKYPAPDTIIIEAFAAGALYGMKELRDGVVKIQETHGAET